MKARKHWAATACVCALLVPGSLLAAQGGVASGGVPSAVVQPNAGAAPQLGQQVAGKAVAPVRSVTAAALVDQSGDQEGPVLGPVAGPVVAGVPEEEAQAPVVPAAPEPKRGWLRQSRAPEQVSEKPQTSTDWSMSVLALVLLGGLAGAAVVLKLRRGAPAPWLPPAAVRVLSSTRLTPKANLITAEVHGRVLLLGVTDSSVTELGWLDGNASAEKSLQAGERDAGEEPEDNDRELSANRNANRAGFGQILGNVFRAGERKTQDAPFRGNPNVAALIAARDTRDVVSTSYSRSTVPGERRVAQGARSDQDPPHVETQVAGLARRRR